MVYEDTDVLSIVDIFLNEPYRRLPVIRENKELVGLVCRREVLKSFYNSIVNKQRAPQDSGILFFSSVTDRSESPIAP
ncbi:MAG: CBS domain-containing protein [Planctomycetaceae bacterium]